MALLNADIQQQLGEIFAGLQTPVRIVVFTQGEDAAQKLNALECQMCSETRQLIDEVAALSDKITVEVRDFVEDSEIAETMGIDKIPAVAILRGGDEPKDYGIRLYGIPSGYEFSTLIEDILMVSRGDAGLNPKTLAELEQLSGPVDIQVFVTPTCPYCPQAVVLAHKLAMASDHVRAAMVEATEFPHLANRYQVYGVPRTVINDVIHVEGAVPEQMLIQKLMAVTDDAQMARLTANWQRSQN